MKKKYGIYGGQFVSELLMPALNELEESFKEVCTSQDFQNEYTHLLKTYVGRETPLYHAKNLSKIFKSQIYFKREDLNHTGAHKINNALGQALLAKKMNKNHIIAETGAGQHGVATATACALLKLKCTVFMGSEDVKRQAINVQKMRLLGAEVIPITSGSKVLKDATNAAIQYWIEHVDSCHYIIGSAIGPYPYPSIVRYFQSIIGKETKEQLSKKNINPHKIIACVGGGSNAIGMFSAFLEDSIPLIGVEAAGKGLNTTEHAATLSKGSHGVIHGSFMYLLQSKHGNVDEVYSISAGLDYPGIGPEHCYLKDINRVRYEAITDQEAIDAYYTTTREEGIIPALESSHAIAQAFKEAQDMKAEENIIICLSGRGDKDLHTILALEAK